MPKSRLVVDTSEAHVVVGVKNGRGSIVVHPNKTAVSISNVIESRGARPSVSAVVLCSADDPARLSDVSGNIFEFGNNQAIVATHPGIAAIRASAPLAKPIFIFALTSSPSFGLWRWSTRKGRGQAQIDGRQSRRHFARNGPLTCATTPPLGQRGF